MSTQRGEKSAEEEQQNLLQLYCAIKSLNRSISRPLDPYLERKFTREIKQFFFLESEVSCTWKPHQREWCCVATGMDTPLN